MEYILKTVTTPAIISDGLSLLMNKLSFNSNKYLLDSLLRNLNLKLNNQVIPKRG